MNKVFLATLLLLTLGTCNGQSTDAHTRLHFDLSKAGMIVDGRQVCEDKGRLQDYPSQVIEQVATAGPRSVPVLIGMIADTRILDVKTPIICYWPAMAVGDMAFCLLADLFRDTSGSVTVPGADWDDLLGVSSATLPAWEQLHAYIRGHGRRALQAKWQRLWEKYGTQMSWDPKERCFKLKARA